MKRMSLLQLHLRSGFYRPAADLETGARNQELVRAVLLHHHGYEGLFPEPGRVQRFLDAGYGDGVEGAEHRGDSDGVFVVGGADHDRSGGALVHLRDAEAVGDLATGGLPSMWSDTRRTMQPTNAADPTPLHHRPTLTPPRKEVRHSTTCPRRRGWEVAPHKNHLSDGDPAPLHQALRLRLLSRNQELVGAVLLHHHGDEALFPEPGRVQRFLDDVGYGDGDAGGCAAALGLWGGGEDLGRRVDADEVCAAYRTLRLRGGAADYYSAADDVPPPSHSWITVMGYPMIQTIPRTCALVAATVCVEAQHRRKFEATYGTETFACRAAAPRRLRRACYRDKVWNPSTGENERTWDPEKGAWSMGRVLSVMKQLGGARTTNAAPPAPFFLPLENWEGYSYRDGGLTAETAARLLYKHGPCIGTLFATPDFFDTFVVPGSNRAPAVFRGRRREDRERDQGTMHAVVCFAYGRSNKGRLCTDSQKNEGRLCIQVLDNQRPTGPVRWVDFDEFDDFYVLRVETLSSVHLLDFHRKPPLFYPVSGMSVTN